MLEWSLNQSIDIQIHYDPSLEIASRVKYDKEKLTGGLESTKIIPTAISQMSYWLTFEAGSFLEGREGEDRQRGVFWGHDGPSQHNSGIVTVVLGDASIMVRKWFITQRISEVFLKPWGDPPSLRMSQMRISRHVGLLRPTNHGMECDSDCWDLYIGLILEHIGRIIFRIKNGINWHKKWSGDVRSPWRHGAQEHAFFVTVPRKILLDFIHKARRSVEAVMNQCWEDHPTNRIEPV